MLLIEIKKERKNFSVLFLLKIAILTSKGFCDKIFVQNKQREVMSMSNLLVRIEQGRGSDSSSTYISEDVFYVPNFDSVSRSERIKFFEFLNGCENNIQALSEFYFYEIGKEKLGYVYTQEKEALPQLDLWMVSDDQMILQDAKNIHLKKRVAKVFPFDEIKNEIYDKAIEGHSFKSPQHMYLQTAKNLIDFVDDNKDFINKNLRNAVKELLQKCYEVLEGII